MQNVMLVSTAVVSTVLCWYWNGKQYSSKSHNLNAVIKSNNNTPAFSQVTPAENSSQFRIPTDNITNEWIMFSYFYLLNIGSQYSKQN